MINNLPTEGKCTGCGACVNVCPVRAIKMVYSKKGFLVPKISDACIECNLCAKSCPSLNPQFKNEKTPKFYSFCANDEIRKVSSSGGMFTVLANYVLKRSGYVCGAAFDDDFQLHHVIVSAEEELPALRYSKYLQSNTEDCYKKIKALLQDDKYVLFVGTPCQVAGLYGVLGRDYEQLITADLLCHGTPSQKFFDKYLKEISKGKKVKDVCFRSKRIGWKWSAIITEFSDSTEHIGRRTTDEKTDPYISAFSSGMMLRWSCYDCRFSTYPRQGDFTIGDLWFWDQLDPKSNDKKGTSFVFANNNKAVKIFEEISSEAKYFNEIKIKPEEYDKIPNRVGPKARISPNRTRFLDLIKTKPFSVAYKYASKKIYDIGMPSNLYAGNIGSVLTYFALYHELTEMGYTVLPIEHPLDAPYKNNEKAEAFVKKWFPRYAWPVQYKNIMDMRALNDRCEQFVVGSDQIFLEKMANTRNDYFFLQWVEERKNKIAYASSFGGTGARGSKKFVDEMKHWLNKFSYISCREDNGVNYANTELKLNQEVIWNIDPIFLCKKDVWNRLVNSVKVIRESEYIGSYVVVPRARISKLLDETVKHFGNLPAEVMCTNKNASQVKGFHYKCKDTFPIEETLESLAHCKFFVTDSFHGVCFSIIFRKDFLAIPRDFPDRFVTLLKRLGLEDRIIDTNFKEVSENSFAPIDYDRVYKKLEKHIESSRNMLASALEVKDVSSALSDVDIAMKWVKKHNDILEDLQQKVGTNQIDSSTILKEAIEKIKYLENKIEVLNKEVLELKAHNLQ